MSVPLTLSSLQERAAAILEDPEIRICLTVAKTVGFLVGAVLVATGTLPIALGIITLLGGFFLLMKDLYYHDMYPIENSKPLSPPVRGLPETPPPAPPAPRRISLSELPPKPPFPEDRKERPSWIKRGLLATGLVCTALMSAASGRSEASSPFIPHPLSSRYFPEAGMGSCPMPELPFVIEPCPDDLPPITGSFSVEAVIQRFVPPVITYFSGYPLRETFPLMIAPPEAPLPAPLALIQSAATSAFCFLGNCLATLPTFIQGAHLQETGATALIPAPSLAMTLVSRCTAMTTSAVQTLTSQVLALPAPESFPMIEAPPTSTSFTPLVLATAAASLIALGYFAMRQLNTPKKVSQSNRQQFGPSFATLEARKEEARARTRVWKTDQEHEIERLVSEAFADAITSRRQEADRELDRLFGEVQ